MASHLTDLVAVAKSRLLSQYQKLTLRFVPLVAGIVGEVQTLEDALWAFYDGLQLDNATGDLLDRFGYLVQEAREGLGDDEFRRFIKAKIIANGSRGRIEDFLAAITAAFSDTIGVGTGFVRLVEIPPLAVELEIGDLAVTGTRLERVRRLVSRTRSSMVRVMLFTSTTGDQTQDFCTDTGPGLGFDDAAAPGSGGALISAVAAPL